MTRTPDAGDEAAGDGATAHVDVAIDAVASTCGCAGKTPLGRVVYPARSRIRDRLSGTSVTLADAEDAAILPLTTGLARSVTSGSDGPRAERASPEDEAWSLAATFGSAALTDPGRFVDAVAPAYAALDGRAPVTVAKGHSVQVTGATTTRQWFEHLVPTGDVRTGYRAANVDVLHAFPGLPPSTQARIALLHSLNDCYAVGGTDERVVRPVVAAPTESLPAAARLREWYEDGAPSGVTVLPAAAVAHDGRGWLFGATATADAPGLTYHERDDEGSATPENGDVVVLSRPLGGLALFASTVAATESDECATEREVDRLQTVRERAVGALTADHVAVARALSAFRPGAADPHDPERHVRFVTDVSGPGVRGVGRRITRAANARLHLTDLPLLDHGPLDRAQERWTTPDVTVESNGPLAVVARPSVADAVVERLASVPGAAPVRIGEVRPGDASAAAVTVAEELDATRYVEYFARPSRQRGAER